MIFRPHTNARTRQSLPPLWRVFRSLFEKGIQENSVYKEPSIISSFLLQLSFACNPALYFNMGKKAMKTCIIILYMFLLLHETS